MWHVVNFYDSNQTINFKWAWLLAGCWLNEIHCENTKNIMTECGQFIMTSTLITLKLHISWKIRTASILVIF